MPPEQNTERLESWDRRDRAIYALCRFVFPGGVVPRAAIAAAVLAALDGDFEALPARQIIRGASELRRYRAALEVEFDCAIRDEHDDGCNPATRDADGCECGLTDRIVRLRAALASGDEGPT